MLALLVERLQVRPVAASSVGFLCGFVVSYLLQRQWVFASDRAHTQTLPRFSVVVGLGLALNATVLWFGTEYFSHHYVWVQLAAFAVAPCNNYVLHSLWTFR